ncbi:hypothetical protein GCM10023074_11790 [Microbispora amethystogenes]|uniref:Uncharacterized protein n=1 Tax=Microbispora amethystogenes TaxID=1427754 RepID=A0ABQ4FKQ6_9ACTN|nr:hypothetical protein Mam01_55070 [Microbispora amethystogenes]
MTVRRSRVLRTAVASAALLASAIAGAALASARTDARPPQRLPVAAGEPPPDLSSAAASPSARRGRRLLRALLLALLLAGIAAAAWGALSPLSLDWVRWTLAGLALAATASLTIAFLVGPAARYLSGERRPLTEIERTQMTASERVEALNAARHTLIQAATGLVVIGGVAFTALGLWYTARTVETARESQITDRYTKAVEQLGSTKQDVRLGGIYALQRLAADSPPRQRHHPQCAGSLRSQSRLLRLNRTGEAPQGLHCFGPRCYRRDAAYQARGRRTRSSHHRPHAR